MRYIAIILALLVLQSVKLKKCVSILRAAFGGNFGIREYLSRLSDPFWRNSNKSGYGF